MRTRLLTAAICWAAFSLVQPNPFRYYSNFWFLIQYYDLYWRPCDEVQSVVSNVEAFKERFAVDTYCTFLFRPYYCPNIVDAAQRNTTRCQVRIVAEALISMCPCPADRDGGWNSWIDAGDVTGCSVACGHGTKTVRQTRRCNNPSRSGNGLDCIGDSSQTVERVCVSENCSLNQDGGWGDWVDGEEVSSCSVTCGPGTRVVRQTRQCNNPPKSGTGSDCSGISTQDVGRDCLLQDCTDNQDGGWGDWVDGEEVSSCSVTCGGGTRVVRQTRECNNPPQSGTGSDCSGISTQEVGRDCNQNSCPVNGSWTDWVETPITGCSATCGGGVRDFSRTRSCTNPPPQFGGFTCTGLESETITRTCNELPLCPVNGGWSNYTAGEPGPCSVECGGGELTRTDTRTCTMPTPAYGGQPCEGGTTLTVTLDCNTQTCDDAVDGGWSDYSFIDVTECSTSCGGGRKLVNKTRYCNNPAPSNGGADCVGDAVESMMELPCNDEDVNICAQPGCLASRIVGGDDAEPCQYPFAVGVRRFDTYTCGGTLIGLNKVLTAAHCVYTLQPSQLVVEVGKHCRSTASSESYNANNPNMEIIDVVGVSVHPSHNPNLNSYDIAVLKLSKDVVITKCRQIIKMAEPETVTQTGRVCTVMGWGTLAYNGEAAALLKDVNLTMYDSADCRNTFPTTASSVSNDVICASNGVNGGKDACNGDSGGPLVCQDNGEWIQYGIVSSGVECARVRQTGLYTEVAAYHTWVDQQF